MNAREVASAQAFQLSARLVAKRQIARNKHVNAKLKREAEEEAAKLEYAIEAMGHAVEASMMAELSIPCVTVRRAPFVRKEA